MKSRPTMLEAYTLVELLCTIAIIILLAALLLPGLSQAKAKVQRVHCVSNLRQMGIGFLAFAQTHENRFPLQVSTNAGGSAEFVDAARWVPGEVYFSYRHFQPLSNEVQTPKILVCPADLQRSAATNFATMGNDNLSYFIGSTPVAGDSDSILSGDRNVEPLLGSIARIGGALRLKWTEELHRYKGNVLFADSHVEQLRDVVEMTNRTGTPATIIVPSVKPPPPRSPPTPPEPAPAPAPDGMAESTLGGSLGHTFLQPTPPGATNGLQTNYTITSGGIGPGRLRTFYPGGVAGSAGQTVSSPLAAGENAPMGDVAPEPPPSTSPPPKTATGPAETQDIATAHEELIKKGRDLVGQGSVVTFSSRIPWWLLLILLLAVMEILRRHLKNRNRTSKERENDSLSSTS